MVHTSTTHDRWRIASENRLLRLNVLVQETAFEAAKYISKGEAVSELSKYGVLRLGDRTLDFYVRQGILKRPTRGASLPGCPQELRKNAFWIRDYIIGETLAVAILRTRYQKSLSYIAQLARASERKLQLVVEDVIELEHDFSERLKRLRGDEQFGVLRMILPRMACDLYFGSVLHGTMRTTEDRRSFQRGIDWFFDKTIKQPGWKDGNALEMIAKGESEKLFGPSLLLKGIKVAT